MLADAAESVLGFADVLQEDGLAGAGDVAWKAMGRLSESLGTESGLGKFVAAAHEEFGNFRRIPMEFRQRVPGSERVFSIIGRHGRRIHRRY